MRRLFTMRPHFTTRPHFTVTLLLLATVAASAVAQEKTTAAKGKKSSSAAADNGPANPGAIPGYQIRKIEGFTVVLSDETLRNQDNSAFERKPLEVLEMEFKTIVRMLKPEAVAVLRGLLIWVEWNEQHAMSNGREGSAAAVYYGGHQLQLLAKGMHPLKAKNITILRMESLTREHQPKHDSGRCVILHEMTHAVHDQFLGYDNQMVKAGYKQALERKLYDPEMYASTNEHEYFAELTCAYFDQLHYYPRTRTDLQKHDPITFEMMETIWGRRTDVATKPTSESSEKINLRLEQIDLGKPVMGASLTADDLKEHPVMLLLWNANSESSLACFQKLNVWTTELSDFGLRSMAIHLTGSAKQEVKQAADSRNVAFPVTEGKWTQGGPVEDFKDFPLCLVFDENGQCVFRGSPFDAEPALRGTVGSALVHGADVEAFPKALTSIVDNLRKGTKSPAATLPLLVPHTRSPDAATADAAKKLLAEMLGEGERTLDEAEALSATDAVGAFVKMMRLPVVFKGTQVATKATTMLGKLKRNKDVALELKAQPALMNVNKIDAELSTRPGNFDPKLPEFRKANAQMLQELQQTVQMMKQQWPATRSTGQALRTAERYGVSVN